MNFLKGHWYLVLNDGFLDTYKYECEQNTDGTIKCTYLRMSNDTGVIKWDFIEVFASDISWDGTEYISEKRCLRGSGIIPIGLKGLIWYRPNLKTFEWRKRKLTKSCFQATLHFKIILY